MSYGDSEKGGRGELVTPGFSGYPGYPGPPGLPDGFSYGVVSEPPYSHFDDEDLVLGVRIYTQGGAVVSVTGQVDREEFVEEDEKDVNATTKAKEDDKKETKEDKKAKDKKKKKHRSSKVSL